MKTIPLILALSAASTLAAPPEPKFQAQDLDTKVQIGYGVAVADVDGDGKPDVLLADKKQYVWYRNPGKRGAAWDKFVLAENLTTNDNVCIAAQDIDGDGKCEIAVGAEWNPGDTVNSGAVFYLIPPADRTQKWEAVKFPSVEPTTHRMRWLRLGDKEWGLVVVPLHGRGNKNGEGAGVKVLLYHKPADVRAEWKAEVLADSMHATHNFDPVAEGGILLGGREGLLAIENSKGTWERHVVTGPDGPFQTKGAGEVRLGRLGGAVEFAATVEPMHGNALVAYLYTKGVDKPGVVHRMPLNEQVNEGHALACGDVLGTGSDQIVIGWRGNAKQPQPVGIKLFTPLDDKGGKWRESLIDDNQMACEDLVLADLDADGKLDIVAAGRATHNLRIYWNER